MLGSYEGAMVDAAAETTPPLGCRTLCQHPGCGQPIVAAFSGWYHEGSLAAHGVPPHQATPVEQPERSPGERLVASVTESYEQHHRAHRVHPLHIEAMAERMCDSRRERTVLSCRGDVDGAAYQRAVRAHERRRLALRRLAYALERQGGGGSR